MLQKFRPSSQSDFPKLLPKILPRKYLYKIVTPKGILQSNSQKLLWKILLKITPQNYVFSKLPYKNIPQYYSSFPKLFSPKLFPKINPQNSFHNYFLKIIKITPKVLYSKPLPRIGYSKTTSEKYSAKLLPITVPQSCLLKLISKIIYIYYYK